MSRLRVSQLCVFLWREGRLVCDDPLRHRQFALSTEAGSLLGHFADWAEAPPVAARSETYPQLIQRLLDAKVLVEEGSAEHEREEHLGPWAEWGTAATYYHLASRTHAADRFASAAEDSRWLKERLDERPQPQIFKEYPPQARLALPAGDNTALTTADLEQALRRRRTTRRLDPQQPMTVDQLACLLSWAAGPLYQVESPGLHSAMLKASPSGGSRHAVEVYPVVLNVDGLEPGIYHYHCGEHALDPIQLGARDLDELVDWCGGQTYVRNCGVLFFYTAVLERTAWKYRMGRVYRSLYTELGHISQTSYLVGASLGLGVFFTAATRDEPVEAALGLDWSEEVLLGLNGFGVPTAQERARQSRMLAGGPADFSFLGDEWDGQAAAG
ncbi:SagB-type dehydrogenase family enzyme [Streptacidiphilus sp. MAP12-20]|uniref:SagB/ThcOx family dehydrogenase n=1 Tax=Streptacidiphilus sp. MAP12-20 TaxID=3156299 RepID=UPI0035145F25